MITQFFHWFFEMVGIVIFLWIFIDRLDFYLTTKKNLKKLKKNEQSPDNNN